MTTASVDRSRRVIPASGPAAADRAKCVNGCRKFTLLDAMILVAATAVGLALTRGHSEDALGWEWLKSAARLNALAWPLLACWTIAMLALRLRRPRPRLGRLARQPGMVACVVAASMLATRTVSLLPIGLANVEFLSTEGFHSWVFGSPGWMMTPVAYAVAGAWLTLALSGRRRPEPGWIDRTGRLLGACWIAIFLINDVGYVLSMRRQALAMTRRPAVRTARAVPRGQGASIRVVGGPRRPTGGETRTGEDRGPEPSGIPTTGM